MATILNIDTATDVASACISIGTEVLALRQNSNQREHGSFINVAIKEILEESRINFNHVDAIAVTIGPGSYTGLRVGLATAKGFCYALNKPLITLSTLKVMTLAALEFVGKNRFENIDLFCPMIDARRMEVFTALYDHQLHEVMPEQAMLLDEASFEDYLKEKNILFFGNGCSKFTTLETLHKLHAIFVQHNASHLVVLAQQAFTSNIFANLAYTEPHYLKEFYTLSKKFKY